MKIDRIEITVKGIEDMSEAEASRYLAIVKEQAGGEEVVALEISAAEDGRINLDYTLRPLKFQRIRRITGYLVGTTDRWNNAKRAEEKDRVKHGITQ